MQVSKEIIEEPEDTECGAKGGQGSQKDDGGHGGGIQGGDQGLSFNVGLEHVHGHGQDNAFKVQSVDQADHQSESDTSGEGRREAERHGVEDNGVGDAHGTDGDQHDMAPDEEDAEDEGEDKVEEKEPLDG